ncbi:MAG: hypothetical protein LBF38_06625 [Deltaproteobacteria bacterium]|jgi:hypothetical protein|nr:hypothetical protein [Deltaproteobacteria bacterium]
MFNQADISLDLGIVFATLGLALLAASGTRGKDMIQMIEGVDKQDLQKILVDYVRELVTRETPKGV